MIQKFYPPFLVGEVVTNTELYRAFHCGNMGGMRRSIATGTLVLISDHTKMYSDKWHDDVLHYTGTGENGDQIIGGNHNRTLAESGNNGVEVHLFEVFEPKRYTYQGVVRLAAPPYQELRPGGNKRQRTVWMFLLKKQNVTLSNLF